MAGPLRVTPPCELLVNPKPHWQQTYVVLGDHTAEAAFKAFAHAQAVNGADMWATHQTRNETYLVMALHPPLSVPLRLGRNGGGGLQTERHEEASQDAPRRGRGGHGHAPKAVCR